MAAGSRWTAPRIVIVALAALACLLLLTTAVLFSNHLLEPSRQSYGWSRRFCASFARTRPDQQTHRPKIAVATTVIMTKNYLATVRTAAGGYGNLKTDLIKELAESNKERYCKLHGYECVVERSIQSHQGLSVLWAKISLIRRILPLYDGVFWMDSDSLFVNYSKRIEDVVDMDRDLSFTHDIEGRLLNNGVFFVRNTPFAVDFFERVWATRLLPEIQQNMLQDQPGMTLVIEQLSGEERARHIRWVDKAVLNAFPRPLSYELPQHFPSDPVDERTFVVHLPGVYCTLIVQQQDVSAFLLCLYEFVRRFLGGLDTERLLVDKRHAAAAHDVFV